MMAIIPQYEDPYKYYVLTIESSKVARGAILTQLMNGDGRVIS